MSEKHVTDPIVAARKLVDELVRAEQIELRRAALLATDLAAYVESLGRAPSGTELEEWLGEHRQVEELYASPSKLEEMSERYFRPPAPEVAPEAREPELEQQLRETLEPGPYLVYADWLQERGDPLGELIVLGVAASSGGADAQLRFNQYLERNEKHFLRGIRKTIGSVVRLDWHNGFITTVDESIDALGAARWQRLFDLRVAMLVRSITLHNHDDPETDALIAERAPALRELRVRLGRMPRKILEGEHLRSLSIYMDHLKLEPGLLPPKLERLELQVRQLERAPELTRIEIRELVLSRSMGRVQGTTFAALGGLDLPNLELIEFAGIDGPPGDTCAIIDAFGLPALRRLVIRGCHLRVADVARICALEITPHLTHLALVDARLSDDALAALRPLRGTLAELDLRENELSPAGVASAASLATRVIVGKQYQAGTAAMQAIRAFAMGRFAAGEELADPAQWRDAGVSDGIRWARYTGTEDYELFVAADLETYGCSCPSRYQPCKHVIALAVIAERIELPRAASGGIEARVGVFRFTE